MNLPMWQWGASNGRKKVVLAVDDMSINLRAIKAILTQTYDVRLTRSGELALDLLKKIRPDLVLLDIEMPGMSGFDVIEEMKNIPGREDIPVIFVTSHATPDLIVSAYDHGAKDYIIKPINPEVLLKKIQALITKSPRPDGAAVL
jgi:putative two-component system response regulator